MSEYTRWQQLNESLGFPLGVKTAASLGITGGFSDFAEAKKKKKMNGEEIDLDIGDDDEGDEEIDLEKGPKMKPKMGLGKKKPCPCGSDDGEDDDDLGDDLDIGDKDGPFCKSCKGMKSGQKKKKGKKCMKEDIFGSYRDTTFKGNPNIGSEEYRTEFLKSVMDHFSNPDKKNGSGVNLGEEVIFEPQDETAPLAQTPVPGSPGSSPYTRLGEGAPPKTPELADWEKAFNAVPTAEQFIKDSGLNASFEDWADKKKA